MRAVMFHGKRDLRVEDVPEGTPGPGQVKLRNAFAGICGSDVNFFNNPDALGIDLTKPHPISGVSLPVVLGHEWSGTVTEIGAGVTDVAVGDRVAVYPYMKCGACNACRKGLTNCPNFFTYGLTADAGGMAEYAVVEADSVHLLPENVSLEMGALVEPMAVAWHGVDRSGIDDQETALVLGAGPIGIGAWFALRSRGVEKIIVSQRSAYRREVIANLGCKHVHNPLVDDLGETIDALTEGKGVDVVIDAAGSTEALETAIEHLAAAGRVVLLAMHGKPVQIDTIPLMLNQKDILGSMGYYPSDYDKVLRAMSEGHYSSEGWVKQMPMEEVLHGIAALEAGEYIKVLLTVQ